MTIDQKQIQQRYSYYFSDSVPEAAYSLHSIREGMCSSENITELLSLSKLSESRFQRLPRQSQVVRSIERDLDHVDWEIKDREIKDREIKDREIKGRKIKNREIKNREIKDREIKLHDTVTAFPISKNLASTQ